MENLPATLQIRSSSPIEWKFYRPEPGEFPCVFCSAPEATQHIQVDIDKGEEKLTHIKLAVCAKCASYALAYPSWLEEVLYRRRLEAFSIEAETI